VYNVPRQTLQQYFKKGEFTITKFGRKPGVEIEAENVLDKYLILCQEVDLESLSALAFSLMENLGVAHRFKCTQKMAGWHPQAYRPQRRELVHKQSIKNGEQISSGGIFRNSGKKHN
jgi:hypothetical protein